MQRWFGVIGADGCQYLREKLEEAKKNDPFEFEQLIRELLRKFVKLQVMLRQARAFDAAIEAIALLHQNRVAQRYLTKQGTGIVLLDAAQIASLVDSAIGTVAVLVKITAQHFGTELPVLREACPKCP